VKGRFGINELITTMPAVSGEKPNGFFAQAPPVCTEFLEQNGTEHHVAVFATLATLDVNHHPSAIMSLTFKRVNSAFRTPVA
jgi:hypothetical protein